MKHEFIGKPIYLESGMCEITIRLIPETVIETTTIQNCEVRETTEAENNMINKYFLSSIPNWSVLAIKSQKGDIFKLKAVKV